MAQAPQAPAVPAPSRGDYVPLAQCRTVIQALKHPETLERFRAAAPAGINPERMLRMTLTAVMSNQDLAACEQWTFLRSALSFAALGIEPNSPLGHGYMIPFEVKGRKQVQAIIGYKGYIFLAGRSGIQYTHGDVVYEGDEFRYQYGTEPGLWHRPRGSRFGRRPIEAYAVMDKTFEARDYRDVLAIRDQSQGYRYALEMRDKGKKYIYEANPWVRHEHPMAAKTMVRSNIRWIAIDVEGTRLAAAAELDGRAETGAKFDLTHTNSGLDVSFIDTLPEDLETNYVQGHTLPGDGDQQQGQDQQQQGQQQGQGQTQQGQDQQRQAAGRKPRAAPGDRQQPAQQRQAAQQKPADTPKQETKQPPAVWMYLADHHGDPIEVDGQMVAYSDATQFLAAFEALAQKTPREALATLLEQNADNIQDACRLSEAVALAFAEWRQTVAEAGQQQESSPASQWTIVVPDGSGENDWLAALRAMLGSATTSSQLAEIEVANALALSYLSKGGRRIADTMLRKRTEEIEAALSDTQETAAGDGADDNRDGKDQEPPEDREAKLLAAMLSDLQKLSSLSDLTMTLRNVAIVKAVERMQRDRSELHEQWVAAVEATKQRLGGTAS